MEKKANAAKFSHIVRLIYSSSPAEQPYQISDFKVFFDPGRKSLKPKVPAVACISSSCSVFCPLFYLLELLCCTNSSSTRCLAFTASGNSATYVRAVFFLLFLAEAGDRRTHVLLKRQGDLTTQNNGQSRAGMYFTYRHASARGARHQFTWFYSE